MAKALIIVAHGLGDCLQGLQVGTLIKYKLTSESSKLANLGKIDILACVRDEVFDPLLYLFSHYGQFNSIIQHPEKEKWGENNWILSNQDALNEYKINYDYIYYVIPDLLSRGPLAFDYQKWGLSLQTIKNTRLLVDDFEPEKRIYMGLATSTKEYLYPYIPQLLIKLANILPNHEIYFPNITKWAGKDINLGDFNRKFPDNVKITNDLDFIENLSILRKSCYGVFVDNGASHCSYHLGQPRLLIDHRTGFGRDSVPWVARWRETLEDSINANSNISDICELIKTNIEIPQTLLLPKSVVINNLGVNWARELIFKY